VDDPLRPEADADVPAFCAALGIPGLADVHTHFLPPRMMRRVWEYFDRAGPLVGTSWPIRYKWSDAERVAHLRGMGVRMFSALAYAHRPGMAEELNAWTMAFARATPGCLPSATFYPEPAVAGYVRDALDAGARVFKIHLQVGGFSPGDPRLDGVWGTLAEARVPVVVHAGHAPVGTEHTGPGPFGSVLARHQGLTAIVAHMGAPDYEAFLGLAARYERVFLDTTMVFTDFFDSKAPFPAAALPLARELGLAGKVCLGSDFPNIPYPYARQLAGLARLGLGERWLRAVCWDNPVALFGEPAVRSLGMRGSGTREAGWRGYPWWSLTAGLAIAAGGFSAVVQGPLWNTDAALAAVNLTTTVLFVFTGLMLRREPGQRGVAWALMILGLLRSLDFVDAWSGPPWAVYALIFGGADRVFGAFALLRYPNSALQRYQRDFLVLLSGWMLIGRALIVVTAIPQWDGAPASSWWLTLIRNQNLNDVVNYVVNAGEGLFAVAFVVLLAMRLTRTTGLDRVVITPVIVAGLAATVAAGASAVTQMLSSLSGTPNGVYVIEGAVDMTLPLAFLVAVIQRTLLLRNITALAAQVSAGADIGAVRYALRSTLHDPTLEILDLSGPGPARDDGPGQSAPGPAEQPADRLVEFIRTEEGSPIAVVLADPALARYRGLFDAAVQTSGLALKNAQLQAQAAREKLEQVRASRARIVEAGLAERQRIERDLHDGVQQHLLGLAAQLTVAMNGTPDATAYGALAQVRDGLREVLAELRDLAHGIHPAVLSQGGLAAALEDVAERLPLPVVVTAPATRVAIAVEATAYFVACEALANVVKHARANSATITVGVDDGQLRLQIADDGVGGIASNGHGLANILDRVNALDGEVTIVSPPGQGTRIEVSIPCD
jgi:uncharacterized protein